MVAGLAERCTPDGLADTGKHVKAHGLKCVGLRLAPVADCWEGTKSRGESHAQPKLAQNPRGYDLVQGKLALRCLKRLTPIKDKPA